MKRLVLALLLITSVAHADDRRSVEYILNQVWDDDANALNVSGGGDIFPGNGYSLTDPAEDRLLFWDDSESDVHFLSVDADTFQIVSQELGLVAPLGFGHGGSNATTRQGAIDALTDSANSTTGYVLTVNGSNQAVFSANTSSLFTDGTTSAYLSNQNNAFLVGTSAQIAKLSVVADANEVTAAFKAASTQDANVIEVKNNSNSVVFAVSVDGTVTGGASGGGVLTLGSSGVKLFDDRDGMLVIKGDGAGQDESLGFNFDDTANVVTVSTDSGVTYISYDSVGTHAGGAIVPKVVHLTDGATVAVDASLGSVFRLVAAGNRTISAPSNEFAGQKIIIIHEASGADRTLSLDSASAGGFRFGTDITGPLTATTSGKQDYLGFVYDATDDKWDLVASRKGY